VIITLLPISLTTGVYVNVNGDVLLVGELIEPAPFDVIVTSDALLNVLPLTVMGDVPQTLPLMLFSVRDGPFTHPHDTRKLGPVVIHPEEFLTVIAWLAFETPVNIGLD
jgi:hypothetical protein